MGARAAVRPDAAELVAAAAGAEAAGPGAVGVVAAGPGAVGVVVAAEPTGVVAAAGVSAGWAATPGADGSGDHGGSPVTVPAGASRDAAAGCRSQLRMYCSAGGSQLNQSSSPAASE
ncbi:hypothetical protein GCM10010409_54750 [Mycolicibacterium diernhoferi]